MALSIGGYKSRRQAVKRVASTRKKLSLQKRLKTAAGLSETEQLLNVTQRVDDSLVELFSASTTKGKGVLSAAKTLTFKNAGEASLAIKLKLSTWTDETTQSGNTYLDFIIPRGQRLDFPTARIVATSQTGILDGTAISNQAPNANMYVDSTADTTEGFADDDDTTITFDDASGGVANNMFKVNDLIRIDNEVCRITSIVDTDGDGAYTPAHFIVDRAVHGTAKADHSNNAAIRLTFFNAYHDFDAFSVSRTDHDGKFKAYNFFGYGRSTSFTNTGILPGSVSFKCYSQAYQELGLSGITHGTHTGLVASTAYQFNITIDGGSAYALSFTTDASNLNFGGRNGILSKIQDVFNTQFHTTSSNLFGKRVSVGIVKGDVRFTSGSYLSTSSVALADSSGSDTDIWGVGRFPAVGDVEGAIESKLPDDTIFSDITDDSISNTKAFMYDDGNGNLVGKGSGTINYESGAIDFVSYPNAEFVFSARYGSALTGKLSADSKNVIESISVQATNSKITGKVNLVVGG